MTSIEFANILKQAGNLAEISNQEIRSRVEIQFNLTPAGVIIENCVFKEDVLIKNANLNCGLKIINCRFEKTLTFESCNAINYDHDFNYDGYHLEFSTTQINGLYFVGNNQIERGVRINNKSIIGKLLVNSINSNKGSFAIHDSIIENQFDISQGNFSGSVEVRNKSTIKAKTRFENVISGTLTFTDSIFESDIHIWSGKTGSLIFNNGVFYDDLHITALPIAGFLTIIGTEFKKSILFTINDLTNRKVGSIAKIYIASCKFSESLIINGDNIQIDNLDIHLSKQLEGALYFNSCNFLNSELSGDNYSGNLVFGDCLFNYLSFNSIYNYSTISIISGKAFGDNPSITITNSNLGKTHFFNMLFNSFAKISIFNSVLTEIITANVAWFDEAKLNPDVASESADFAQKREIFRQLKYSLERQGNRIESLKFKSLEISAFKKELFSSKKWYNQLFNNDRFVLWLGQTNNFGLNWIKPVFLILGFGLIFYFLIVVGISDKLDYCLNFNSLSLKNTINELLKNFYSFPQLMNPVNNIENTFPDVSHLSFIVHLFDYLLKIFLAFFIFQIISAFRKFMK